MLSFRSMGWSILGFVALVGACGGNSSTSGNTAGSYGASSAVAGGAGAAAGSTGMAGGGSAQGGSAGIGEGSGGSNTACTAAGESFTSKLTGPVCVITLRVDYDVTSILGYQVSCGDEATVTEESAIEPFLPMSSVNWLEAPPISDPQSTGVYAFEDASGAVMVVVSARTGADLAYVVSGSPSYSIPTDWLDGSEIDGDCPDAETALFATFGSVDSSFNPESAVGLIGQLGLFAALDRVFGGEYDTVGAARVDLEAGAEYLVIVTINPRV